MRQKTVDRALTLTVELAGHRVQHALGTQHAFRLEHLAPRKHMCPAWPTERHNGEQPAQSTHVRAAARRARAAR